METKVCPICAETIKTAAKKCPHCHHWQNKWQSIAFDPSFAIICVSVFLGCLLIMLGNSFDPGRSFVPYRDQIIVLESSMNYSQTDKGPMICTVGKVKNTSKVAWKEVQLEAQYFDKEGKLIDTGAAQPQASRADRARSCPSAAGNRHDSLPDSHRRGAFNWCWAQARGRSPKPRA